VLGFGRLGRALFRLYHDRYDIRGVKRTAPDDAAPCPLLLTPIQSAAVDPWLAWAEAIVFCPASGGRNDDAAYRETYLGNLAFVLARLEALGAAPNPIVLIGSTGVYPKRNGVWTEERAIPVETPRQEVLLATERALIASGRPHAILRCGGIYGDEPGRFERYRALGGVPRAELTDRTIPLVHREDLCDVIHQVIERRRAAAPGGDIFNVVDDSNLRQRDWLASVARRLGLPILDGDPLSNAGVGGASAAHAASAPPVPPGEGARVSNGKLKQALGFTFRHMRTDAT
jgi:nucleoside-diphosphate-sugar epimerase